MKLQLIIAITGLSLSCLGHAAPKTPIKTPELIAFGQSVKSIKNKLKNACEHLKIQSIDPPEIPGTINTQTQLDCHGFEFAGKHRLAEFVFKDDALFLTWILIEADEIEMMEHNMKLTYGAAKYQNPTFSAFTQQRTALRKDVPELLFYSEEAAPQFEGWFQSAE